MIACDLILKSKSLQYKSPCFTDTNSIICKMIVGRYRLPLSLRGAQRRGNLKHAVGFGDCTPRALLRFAQGATPVCATPRNDDGCTVVP